MTKGFTHESTYNELKEWYTTLPVSKNAEKFRTVRDFAGGGHRPHENLPRLSESGQGLF